MISLEKNRLRFVVEQYKQYRCTKDVDSDVDVFLSGLVLGRDGVASRVAPQTDGDGHNRRGVSGLNLKSQKIHKT